MRRWVASAETRSWPTRSARHQTTGALAITQQLVRQDGLRNTACSLRCWQRLAG